MISVWSDKSPHIEDYEEYSEVDYTEEVLNITTDPTELTPYSNQSGKLITN